MGAYSLEDTLASGALADLIVNKSPRLGNVANDEMEAALSLWHTWASDTETCLRIASHGKRLISIGNHDEDFKCCSSIDQLSVVPKQQKEGVLCAS